MFSNRMSLSGGLAKAAMGEFSERTLALLLMMNRLVPPLERGLVTNPTSAEKVFLGLFGRGRQV